MTSTTAKTYEEQVKEALPPISPADLEVAAGVIMRLHEAGILGNTGYDKAMSAIGLAAIYVRQGAEAGAAAQPSQVRHFLTKPTIIQTTSKG